MLKVLIGGFVVLLCAAIGSAYSGVYKKRVDFYSSLLSFNSELKRNLFFRRENVAGILQSKKEYASLCGLYRPDEESSDRIVSEFLAQEQCDVVKEYFSSVGKRDGEAEEKFLDYYEGVFKAEYDKCVVENCKYKSLGKKLGLSLGLVFFILIL